MSSEKRREASRQNGKKGKGPTSAAGKTRARFNALRDGISAAGHVLPGEDRQARQQITDGYLEYWDPFGIPEIRIVHRMVDDEWRLERFLGSENGYLQRGQDQGNGGPVDLAQPSDEQILRLKAIIDKRVALIKCREAADEGHAPTDEELNKENAQRAELYAALLEGIAPAVAGGRLTLLYERMERIERSLERKMTKLMELQARRKGEGGS